MKVFAYPFFRKACQYMGLFCLSILASNAKVSAQETTSLSEIRTVLAEPITLILKNGNQQSGRIIGWDGESIRIEVSLGDGLAEVAFPTSDIRQIVFPGNEYLETLYEWTQDPAQTDDALELFNALYRQRGAYFSLLREHELAIFVSYAEFALKHGQAIRAVAVIDAITPYIKDASILRRLENNLMWGFFRGGMRDEAEAKAREWIKNADPAGPSALGWRLLAELNYENERFEEAFWIALHPVAFSNQMPMEHLDVCYALALLSAEKIRLKEEPIQLSKEMHERGFAWPEHVEILKGQAPESFRKESKVDSEATDLLDADPLQTPSPVDPVQSLPTRINF